MHECVISCHAICVMHTYFSAEPVGLEGVEGDDEHVEEERVGVGHVGVEHLAYLLLIIIICRR